MSVLRPQADCGGASSRLQQSRARCEQVRITAAIFFAKTKMGWIDRVVNKHAKNDGKPFLVDDARQRLIDELDRAFARNGRSTGSARSRRSIIRAYGQGSRLAIAANTIGTISLVAMTDAVRCRPAARR